MQYNLWSKYKEVELYEDCTYADWCEIERKLDIEDAGLDKDDYDRVFSDTYVAYHRRYILSNKDLKSAVRWQRIRKQQEQGCIASPMLLITQQIKM